MPELLFTPKFVRQWKKLSPDLQVEVEMCLQKLEQNPRDKSLKAHKLTGKLGRFMSCSVNYRYRVVFTWDDKNTIAILKVGDHSIYG